MSQNPTVTIIVDLNQVNQILSALDKEPHAQVRLLIDGILEQANRQITPKVTPALDEEPAEERE